MKAEHQVSIQSTMYFLKVFLSNQYSVSLDQGICPSHVRASLLFSLPVYDPYTSTSALIAQPYSLQVHTQTYSLELRRFL